MNLRFFAAEGAPSPVGAVVMWMAPVIPPGWLTCDGSSQLRASFSKLFAALGTLYGVGDDDPNTFALPDFRGQFPRGIDAGRDLDPDAAGRTAPAGGLGGDNVGTTQANEFTSHNHQGDQAGPTPQGSFGLIRTSSGGVDTVDGASVDVSAGEPDVRTGPQNIPLAGGSAETRPTNIYCSFIIRVN